jgi:SNF2 family DNA or RNA helicase
MLRRLKYEVQKELPKVTYDKIYLDPSDKLISLTEQEHEEFNAQKTIGETSSIRHALGIIKAAAAIKHLNDVLEEKAKVVVFIWHKDVAQLIYGAFPEKAVLYTGAESLAQKDEALQRFQEDPSIRLFIGNLQSAGIGVDGLQYVCDTCIFIEMSYVPEEIRQAVSRLDRMGQKNPVQAQFLISENSVDEDVLDRLTEKAKNINIILNERRLGEKNEKTEFVATTCKVCGKATEIHKLKRAAKLTVCENCRKEMECVL